jgi:hypothetical protein
MDSVGQRSGLAPRATPRQWIVFGLLGSLGLLAGAIALRGRSYSPVEADKQFPGSVGWMYAHPSLSAAIGAAIVVAIGAIVVVSHVASS